MKNNGKVRIKDDLYIFDLSNGIIGGIVYSRKNGLLGGEVSIFLLRDEWK